MISDILDILTIFLTEKKGTATYNLYLYYKLGTGIPAQVMEVKNKGLGKCTHWNEKLPIFGNGNEKPVFSRE